MEKNTVCMDLDAYTNLVKTNQSLEIELDKLKHEILPRYEDDFFEAKHENECLKKELIIACIDEFNIEHYSLKDVLSLGDFRFAIKEEKRKKLHSLGISDIQMRKEISQVKKQYDNEHKGDKE